MSEKRKIGLVQINNSFSGQNYLPYSIGILQAYAQAHSKDASRLEFMLPLYTRESVESAVEKLLGADSVFFSTYVWNYQISLAIAKELKRRDADIVTVFGGPHVPDRIEGFLEEHPFVDVACHGEGERTFLALVDLDIADLRARKLEDVPSISFLNADGERVTTEKVKKMKDISEVPSPYLDGTFKELMKQNPDERWIVMWETNRGCPFSCAYCDWGSATQSRVTRFDMDRIYREVDWFADNGIEFVFCADANFGMLPRDYDIVQYCAKSKDERGFPQALSVQNTKNATERAYKVQKALSDAGLNKGVTIALQTSDPQTLKNIKRNNISTESFQELQRRFTRDRVDTYTDIILALPGETKESFIRGVCDVIENGQHNRIQFGNLSILPNAAMGDPEYQKEHELDMVETPVVNFHGSLAATDNEIMETQVLVVGNKTLSREDWVKVRSFSWTAALFHFNKILQIPFLLLNNQADIRFRDLFTLFCDGDLSDYPILNEMQQFFYKSARDIQKGGPEYVSSKEWLNIWWPADELALIHICTRGQLPQFYEEAERLLINFLRERKSDFPEKALKDAIHLNHGLMKLPFQTDDLTVDLSHNIWEVVQAARVSEKVELEEIRSSYKIDRTSKTWDDWQTWCREVIWWGNKKGAYLYTNIEVDRQMDGHF